MQALNNNLSTKLKKQKIKDNILNIITWIVSSFGFIILITLLTFIFVKGSKTLSFDLLFSNYSKTTYSLEKTYNASQFFIDPKLENTYFSSIWGISLQNDKDAEGLDVVTIAYIDENSPFNELIEKNSGSSIQIKVGYQISKIVLIKEDGKTIYGIAKKGASDMVDCLNQSKTISDVIITTGGGGIRGSLLTTIYLIIITLIIAIPLGVGGAIYLNEYAKDNKFTAIIRTMIDMTSGIPSIIFGLVGAIIFIPIFNKVINSSGGSIISGAFTMSIILLPIIIKTTEEALKAIPQDYRNASLALGASKIQTIFKVILPNAINGILTAILLSIGRIIGESAALIYAIGTAIKDKAILNEKSTTLAVHIWTLLEGDNPNYEHACAIAIVILLTVLVLSILIKIVSKFLNKEKNNAI
jgi:phosphate ABC transporter, permease protein pstA